MTDQEINEAVAKKLGWEKMQNPAVIGEGYLTSWKNPTSSYGHPPDYCHSIEAAWEIVEKIKETELFALCFHDGQWHCEINCVDGERPIDQEADTAPMAICKAFLKLNS